MASSPPEDQQHTGAEEPSDDQAQTTTLQVIGSVDPEQSVSEQGDLPVNQREEELGASLTQTDWDAAATSDNNNNDGGWHNNTDNGGWDNHQQYNGTIGSDGQATCKVCLDDQVVEADRKYIDCGHWYCLGCLQSLFDVGLANRSNFPPRCCHEEIGIECVENLINIDSIARYISIRDEFRTKDPMYCANKACAKFLPEAPKADGLPLMVTCSARADEPSEPSCGTVSCVNCRELRSEHTADESGNLQCPDSVTLAGMSEIVAEKKYKQCPGCRQMVERIDGCPDMTCECGVLYCYICGQKAIEGVRACRCADPDHAGWNLPDEPEWVQLGQDENGEDVNGPVFQPGALEPGDSWAWDQIERQATDLLAEEDISTSNDEADHPETVRALAVQLRSYQESRRQIEEQIEALNDKLGNDAQLLRDSIVDEVQRQVQLRLEQRAAARSITATDNADQGDGNADDENNEDAENDDHSEGMATSPADGQVMGDQWRNYGRGRTLGEEGSSEEAGPSAPPISGSGW